MTRKTKTQLKTQFTTDMPAGVVGGSSATDIVTALNNVTDSALLYNDLKTIYLDNLQIGSSSNHSDNTTKAAANQAAIIAAKEELIAAGGGTIILPPGIICITGGIKLDFNEAGTVRQPVRIMGTVRGNVFREPTGAAPGTYIEVLTDVDGVLLRCYYSRVSQIVFDAVESNKNVARTIGSHVVIGDGAQLVPSYYSDVTQGDFHQDAYKCMIDNCEFRRAGKAGVTWKDGQNAQFYNCRFYSNYGCAIFLPSGYFDNNHGQFWNNYYNLNGRGGIINSDKPYQTYIVDAEADTLTINNHTYATGQRSYDLRTTGTVPGGLSLGVEYYVIKVDGNTIKLATSASNANAGIAIDILDVGTGTQSIRLNHYTSNSHAFIGENKFYQNGVAGIQSYGDSWHGRIFLERHFAIGAIPLYLLAPAEGWQMDIFGDASDAAPGNWNISDIAQHQLTGYATGFGRICQYFKARTVELTQKTGFGGGGKLDHSATNTVSISGTRASSGRFIFRVLKGTMQYAGFAIGNTGALYDIPRTRYVEIDIGNFTAGQRKTFTLTVDEARRDNVCGMVCAHNANRPLPTGLLIDPGSVRSANAGGLAGTISFDIVNITGSTINGPASGSYTRFTYIGFYLGESGWE